MDPSLAMLYVHNTFSEIIDVPSIDTYHHKTLPTPSYDIPNQTLPIYDVSLKENVSRLEQAYRISSIECKGQKYLTYADAVQVANPFTDIPNPFKNSEALLLANIDAVFDISYHKGSSFDFQTRNHGPRAIFFKIDNGEIKDIRDQKDDYLTLQIKYNDRITFYDAERNQINPYQPLNLNDASLTDFSYICMGENISGFTEYLGWRRPESYGFGIAPQFMLTPVEETRFLAYKGPNTGDNGDITKYYQDFINLVQLTFPKGVDFAIASSVEKDENILFPELLTEVYTAFVLLKEDSNFVFRVTDITEKQTADLIYLVQSTFEEFVLFKPITSPSQSNERWCIGLGYHQYGYEVYLKRWLNGECTSLFETLPEDYLKYLTKWNNWSLENQRITATNIVTLLTGGTINLPKYDLHKADIIWNLP